MVFNRYWCLDLVFICSGFILPEGLVDLVDRHLEGTDNVFDRDPAHYRYPAHFRNACI